MWKTWWGSIYFVNRIVQNYYQGIPGQAACRRTISPISQHVRIPPPTRYSSPPIINTGIQIALRLILHVLQKTLIGETTRIRLIEVGMLRPPQNKSTFGLVTRVPTECRAATSPARTIRVQTGLSTRGERLEIA